MVFYREEGLKIIRFIMVLASFFPLFLLWAIKGTSFIKEPYFLFGCAVLIIVPNLILYLRINESIVTRDEKSIKIGRVVDQRGNILVYLFAILLPIYALDISDFRGFIAAIVALLLILYIFWVLNLYYLNIFFSIFGYRTFTVYPSLNSDSRSSLESFILITQRSYIQENDQIVVLRISDTIFFEPKQGSTNGR